MVFSYGFKSKGISPRQNDWLGSKRYKDLPEWHLGKGNEKEGLVAPHKPFLFNRRD
jgi:hypothetical protein